MAGTLLVGWFLSVAVLLAGLVLFFARISSGSTARAWGPFCAATFAAVLAMKVSEQLALCPGEASPVMTALFGTIQAFILESDAPSMTDEIQTLLGALAKPYVSYGVFLALVAPLATAGSAILAFSYFMSLPLLWLRSAHRETYVFSELNESSLALASSIQNHYASQTPRARCAIAFAHCDACDDEDLLAEARKPGMLLSSMSVDRLMRWCRGREHSHVVLSERSSAANVAEGLRLTEMVPQAKKRLAASVHVFSDVDDTEGFADIMAQRVARRGGCKVRRIDPTAAAVRYALAAYPLFLTGEPAGTMAEELYGRASRRILVIGADSLASAFLKAALWCGRAHGVHMTIDVVDDAAASLREQLAFSCPEIMANVSEDGYDLRFHECSCASQAFLELLDEIGCKVTYVFVSQDDDLTAAGVARRVRGQLEARRMRACATGAQPLVLAAISDTSIATALGQAQTPQGQPCGIGVVPRGNELLTYENLFVPEAERSATNLNRAYWGCFDAPQEERATLAERADGAFESSEFIRLSSAASVVFCKHVLFSFCRRIWAREIDAGIDAAQLPGASAWLGPIDSAAMTALWDAYERYVAADAPAWLSRLEHERWMAYVRTLGYELADGPALAKIVEAGTIQNQLAKLHAYLVDYDKMPAVNDTLRKVLNMREILSFAEADKLVIRHLPEIIRSAN